jgi:hypothetical protein
MPRGRGIANGPIRFPLPLKLLVITDGNRRYGYGSGVDTAPPFTVVKLQRWQMWVDVH